jgi:catechol 2,3-dioxygenase-like lactoylglutathione lyase family enzyme
MSLFRIFAVYLIAAGLAVAQPFPQNPRSVALAHIHLNSADPDAAIAFWKDVIGTSTYSRESVNGVSMLGALIVFTRSAPSGPSVGSVIDHLGLQVPDLQPFIEKLAKTPFKSFQPSPAGGVLMIDGPDGVRIELTEDSSMYAPLEFGHIHFHTTQPNDTQAWYAKHFGARPVADDPLHSSRLAGATLTFAQADSAAPTAGRAIDHISFEVKDLRSFCDTLAAGGIKLDSPFQSTSSTRVSTVFLTDHWGTRIELMESPGR